MAAKRREFIDHKQRMKENHPENFANIIAQQYSIDHPEGGELLPKGMAFTNSSIYHLIKNLHYDTMHPNKMTRREGVYAHIETCKGTIEYIDTLISQCRNIINKTRTTMQMSFFQEIFIELQDIKNEYSLEIMVRENYIKKNNDKNPYIPKQKIAHREKLHSQHISRLQNITYECNKRLNPNIDEGY